MKKQLLLGVVIGIGSFAFAQKSPYHDRVTPLKQKASLTHKTERYQKFGLPETEAITTTSPFTSEINSRKRPRHIPSRAYTTNTLGTTGYQSQTNSSINNRIIKSADGTISATWTYSNQMSNWTERGTGYNYFDGSNWATAPTARVENIRVGWPNIGITAAGEEIVVSHEASNLHISKRSTKGTGTWSDAAFLGAPDVWSRLAVGGQNGNTLHVISQTSGSAPSNPPYQGQDGALAYSRSLDGGATWDKLHTVIPEIDLDSYFGFGADVYAIDTKGDTVVIVFGGWDCDVAMIKSIDNGVSWTKTIIHAFPIPLYDGATMDTDMDIDGTADTIQSNDGSVAVLLDHQGIAHVWYGNWYVYEDPGETAIYGLGGTDGLMYWNENMSPADPVMITSASDIDGDGQLNVTDLGTYHISLTSHANAGIDANGNIYVSYSGIFEGDAEFGTPGDGKSFRHVYVMSSPDNGVTWCDPIDVSDPPGASFSGYTEGVYGAMAKDVDDYIHLIVETDDSPGHGVGTLSATDPQNGLAEIQYKKIPVADVSICTASIHENASSLSSMELYPNPVSAVANLEIYVAKKGNVTIKIYNVTGQLISEVVNNEYAAGKYNFHLDLGHLQAGIYIVNMTCADGIVTKKMTVK
jgi:hypothetical protein